jgi:hypothetical protein
MRPALVINTTDRRPPRRVGGGLDDPTPTRPTPTPPASTAAADQALAAARNDAEIARRDATDARRELAAVVAKLGETRRALADAERTAARATAVAARATADADRLRARIETATLGRPQRTRPGPKPWCPPQTGDDAEWAAAMGDGRAPFACPSCGARFWVRRHAEAHIDARTWPESDFSAAPVD